MCKNEDRKPRKGRPSTNQQGNPIIRQIGLPIRDNSEEIL